MSDSGGFLWATCQIGAEKALKHELARDWPDLRLAFSRPGFLTFKYPAGHPLAERLSLRSVFARAAGYSLGKVTGESVDELAGRIWPVVGERKLQHVHVWQRDLHVVGDHGYDPGPTSASLDAAEAIKCSVPINARAEPGQTVIDCVIVEPNEWWIGHHMVASHAGEWPGGIMPISAPPDMVSRAFLKMEEALAWSQLPIRAGDRCVELGSAPGGASQALLAHGLIVTGIDPAAMDERIVAHPSFHHLRMRGADLKRRDYRGVRWLVSDMNVLPWATLSIVEAIVTHRQVDVEGLLLTLKLADWSLAADVPNYLDRVRSWGYRHVRARQLAHNRQEVCLAACKSRPPGSN